MDELLARETLTLIGQQHILTHWKELASSEQSHLLAQIEQLNTDTFKEQQALLKKSQKKEPQEIHPFTDQALAGSKNDWLAGKEMIKRGEAGCVIVAGGQGTRLGFDGPKGAFPVSPIKGKSLFQLFSEKVAAAGREAGRVLPLAIMTSSSNHEETIFFFHTHKFFGLDPSQVSFFSQGSLPLLDESCNLFLESKGSMAMGPDGNGLSLHHFFKSGILSKWKEQGILALNFIVIDNPLADPFDAELLGYHKRLHNDVSIKCIERKSAEEKVGVLATSSGKPVVVEYSELPPGLANAKNEKGKLLFSCANISSFCFDLNFIGKVATSPFQMPLHLAFKSVKQLGPKDDQAKAWKFETFIFDLLPFAKSASALLYPREICFAPLKNAEGKDSVATVQKALQENDRRVLLEITGLQAQDGPIELSQDFYYPTQEFSQSLFNQETSTTGYIER